MVEQVPWLAFAKHQLVEADALASVAQVEEEPAGRVERRRNDDGPECRADDYNAAAISQWEVADGLAGR